MNATSDPTVSDCTTCCECCKEIPLDAALTAEGSEYVLHFCGLECYQRFQARAQARAVSDTAPADNSPGSAD
uniref:Urf-2 protein n=1 Tax=Xanthomonas campestris TaxID=339 RepID=Q9RCD7_XANCA|nr:Urf-2 protein [Xanthomonas campestris]